MRPEDKSIYQARLLVLFKEKASVLFIQSPTIEKFDIITAKLPQVNKNDYEE